MNKTRIPNVTLYDVELIWKNFRGEKNIFGKEEREFSIKFKDEHKELIDMMRADGWPIKDKEPSDEYEQPLIYLGVKVAFNIYPPKIIQITSGGRNQIGELNVGELDRAVFSRVDVTLTPYRWEVNGKTGIKPYLQSLYVTLYEDELDRYYNSGDGSDQRTI